MNIDHPTLFDDILGTPVPTLHRSGAEQRDALEAEQRRRAAAAWQLAESAEQPTQEPYREARP